jgi:hypothetical protein
MPLPWPSSLLPQAAILALAAGVAGGILGGFIGRALSATRPPARAPRGLLAAAVVVAVACIMNTGSPTSATVAVRDVTPPPHRTVAATVRLSPRGAAEDAQWLTVTAWQGGGLVVGRLQRVADGVYRTTQPIPVYGKWKAMIRMENGRAVDAAPLYLPNAPAIPAKGVPPALGAPGRSSATRRSCSARPRAAPRPCRPPPTECCSRSLPPGSSRSDSACGGSSAPPASATRTTA